MNKLTAEVARKEITKLNKFHKPWMSESEKLYLEALEIALPILEQERGEWIEWGGGDRPEFGMVDVRFRSGKEWRTASGLVYWGRGRLRTDYDIIAYRIIPEQSTNQNGEQWYG